MALALDRRVERGGPGSPARRATGGKRSGTRFVSSDIGRPSSIRSRRSSSSSAPGAIANASASSMVAAGPRRHRTRAVAARPRARPSSDRLTSVSAARRTARPRRPCRAPAAPPGLSATSSSMGAPHRGAADAELVAEPALRRQRGRRDRSAPLLDLVGDLLGRPGGRAAVPRSLIGICRRDYSSAIGGACQGPLGPLLVGGWYVPVHGLRRDRAVGGRARAARGARRHGRGPRGRRGGRAAAGRRRGRADRGHRATARPSTSPRRCGWRRWRARRAGRRWWPCPVASRRGTDSRGGPATRCWPSSNT